MNRRMVFSTVGNKVCAEALMLLLPLCTAAIYRERCFSALLITIGIAAAVGVALTVVCRPKSSVIYAKEGFCITALAW